MLEARQIGRVELDQEMGARLVVLAAQHLSVLVKPGEIGAVAERYG